MGPIQRFAEGLTGLGFTLLGMAAGTVANAVMTVAVPIAQRLNLIQKASLQAMASDASVFEPVVTYLTYREVADRLGGSYQTIRRNGTRGKFPTVRIDGQPRVPSTALLDIEQMVMRAQMHGKGARHAKDIRLVGIDPATHDTLEGERRERARQARDAEPARGEP